ncbi:hypothetical protein DE4585_02660 [Mycobacteroides salmoniphilum]|uniref:DUF3558 domain-containing protein n=1 Tax=Mycobacteroides salmoniphilum TaxID=404941 RepID=A0A4R8S5F1_9MYCO|nr:DUF3558 family protein [Mycobacteroides salmoniphilum]TDZ82128.1 hypothetical protein DE4585_02660 [Mycobacteroides salmoniphilum]
MKWIAAGAFTAVFLAGCTYDGIQVPPTSGSVSSSAFSATTSITSATPRTSSDPVKGTTFDGCAAVTDADLIGWEVEPSSRQDAHNIPFGQNVRGCMWIGPKWGIKIYAVDANLNQLEQPAKRFDRQERVQIGTRSGWLMHTTSAIGCAIAVPSQKGVAAVQVDLKLDRWRCRLCGRLSRKYRRANCFQEGKAWGVWGVRRLLWR